MGALRHGGNQSVWISFFFSGGQSSGVEFILAVSIAHLLWTF